MRSDETADSPREAPFGSVAVCVDGSPASADAVALAHALAGADGELTLIHAAEPILALGWGAMMPIPDEEWRAMGEQALEQAAADAPDAERVLLPGNPRFAISDWVEANGPDAVVCAAHHGPMERLALGSVSSYLAYHLSCPVAIARPELERPRSIAHVAACIDGDEHAPEVLSSARHVADAHAAQLTAVHVADDIRVYVEYGWAPDPDEWDRRWTETMDEMIGDIPCERVVLEGEFAGPAIRGWAEESNVDLLVLAAHRGAMRRFFLGGVANDLAHHAPCDLLIGRGRPD